MTEQTTTETNPEAFLAVAPRGYGGYFGKGATADEAKAELRKQGASLSGGYFILAMPPGAETVGVSMMGDITWRWAEGADRTGQPVEVRRYRVKRPA
jgi:hypothetical protein